MHIAYVNLQIFSGLPFPTRVTNKVVGSILNCWLASRLTKLTFIHGYVTLYLWGA